MAQESKIIIDASLSPEYERAFKAAQATSKQLASSISSVTREEAAIKKAIEARAAIQRASDANDLKAKKRAQAAYDKLISKMKAEGKSIADLDGSLKRLADKRKGIEKLQEVMNGRLGAFQQNSLAKSINEANSAFDKLSTKTSKVKSALVSMGRAGVSALKQVGIGALRQVGASMVGMIGNEFDALMQQAGDYAANAPLTGMSETQYSGLVRQLAYNNLGAGDIQTMFQKAADLASGAASGEASSLKTLSRLGLSASSLNGLSQREQVEVLLNALTGMSGAKAIDASKDVFGKQGASLVAQLQKSGWSGTRLFEEAGKRNESEEQLEKLHAVADKMVDMREKVQNILLEFVSKIDINKVGEIMQKLLDFFMKVVPILAGPLEVMINKLIAFVDWMMGKKIDSEDSFDAIARGQDLGGRATAVAAQNNTYVFGSTSTITAVRAIKTDTDEHANEGLQKALARDARMDVMKMSRF